MQNKTSIIAASMVVILAAAALYQYRENQELAGLQSEIEQLRAQLSAQEGLNAELQQNFENQIDVLEGNLSSAAIQISNLSAALQEARENYFSELEAENQAAN